MPWTVKRISAELQSLKKIFPERTIIVGGRWGIRNISIAGDQLGPVEFELDDLGIDDQGRVSLAALASYLGESPEFHLLSRQARANLIARMLPPARTEAELLAREAVEQATRE